MFQRQCKPECKHEQNRLNVNRQNVGRLGTRKVQRGIRPKIITEIIKIWDAEESREKLD